MSNEHSDRKILKETATYRIQSQLIPPKKAEVPMSESTGTTDAEPTRSTHHYPTVADTETRRLKRAQ